MNLAQQFIVDNCDEILNAVKHQLDHAQIIARLERAAKQRSQNYDNETTTYIFADRSAIVNHNDDYKIVKHAELSPDNEQLN